LKQLLPSAGSGEATQCRVARPTTQSIAELQSCSTRGSADKHTAAVRLRYRVTLRLSRYRRPCHAEAVTLCSALPPVAAQPAGAQARRRTGRCHAAGRAAPYLISRPTSHAVHGAPARRSQPRRRSNRCRAAGRAAPYLISRCTVCFFMYLLYFFSSRRSDVFFRFCAAPARPPSATAAPLLALPGCSSTPQSTLTCPCCATPQAVASCCYRIEQSERKHGSTQQCSSCSVRRSMSLHTFCVT